MEDDVEYYTYHICAVMKNGREFGATERDIAKGLAEWMLKHIAAARDVKPKETASG